MSRETVIVMNAVADALLADFAKPDGSLTTGRPDEPVHLASAADREPIDPVADLVDEAVSKGARLLADGLPVSGMSMSATVTGGVASEMEIYSAESAGPATACFRARIEDHVMGIARDTKHDLAGSVIARDVRHELDVAGCMQTGTAKVNGRTMGDEARMPFGGSRSGKYWQFGGFAAIDARTELRRVRLKDPNSDGQN